jgi:hypothetical protein
MKCRSTGTEVPWSTGVEVSLRSSGSLREARVYGQRAHTGWATSGSAGGTAARAYRSSDRQQWSDVANIRAGDVQGRRMTSNDESSDAVPRYGLQSFNSRTMLFGAAIAQLAMSNRPITIQEFPSGDNSLFEISSDDVHSLVLFKYAAKPKSPWPFTVTRSQLDILTNADRNVSGHRRFFALVCRIDGVCLLSLSEFHRIVTPDSLDYQWGLSVSRPAGGSYRVNGPGRRRLDRTIARTRWATSILDGTE